MKLLLSLTILLFTLSLAQSQSYSNYKGLKHLYYAKTAYCEPEEINTWNCPSCDFNGKLTDVHVLTSDQFKSQSFIGYNPAENQVVISFRGTQNARNWMSNLNTLTTPYNCNDCKVHKGFFNVWQSQQDMVLSKLQQIMKKHSSASIIVTGHSLGGAVSTHCALFLKQNGYKVVEHITFGAPRVGNENFSTYTQQMLPFATRIVRKKDPVPHVPIRLQGFRHHSIEHHYNDKSDPLAYDTCTTVEKKTCANQYGNISVTINVGDHLEYLGISTDCSNNLSQAEFEDIEIEDFDEYDFFKNSGYEQEIIDDIPIDIESSIDLDIPAHDWVEYQLPVTKKVTNYIKSLFE